VFAITEDALFALSHGRGERQSLHASLRADPAYVGTVERLERWANEAAFRRPFEFYSGVLGRDGIREKMIGRLGQEAGDILDEFLGFALAQEKAGLPGLETFLATLETSAPEIKREMDQTRDEVRIMTVHAAKGLEAPMVFLVDSGSAPFHNQHLPRLMPFAPSGILRGGKGYLWRAPGEKLSSRARRIEFEICDRADDEYRRLLYVGMTRAEDRLIVCGFHGKQAPRPSTWHSLVTAALVGTEECTAIEHPIVAEQVHRFRIRGHAPGVVVESLQGKIPEEVPTLPDTLLMPLPPAKTLPRPLAPSGASSLTIEAEAAVVSGRSPVLEPEQAGSFAMERGMAVHKLLQMLPDIDEPERHAAARRFLDRIGGGWPAHEKEAALDSVLAILDTPGFRALFSPGSRAEVSIMGYIDLRGDMRAVSGKIDRLSVSGDEVLIVDYKTNRPAPAAFDSVPPAYVTQLALYRALLRPIYPGRKVTAALLFSEAPRLIALPVEVLDEALARLTKA
jgi:ATP-dependent helicase/nuclease subunit A